MTVAHLVVLLVAVERLSEVFRSSRNERALRSRGAIEAGRGHYPVIVLLHGAWLVAILAALQPAQRLHLLPLGLFAVLQLLRLWVVKTLGPFWTTRVMTVPGAPLVRTGPYRFARHPNYLIVIGEIALLPLAFGQVGIAIAFSIANLLMLAWRIRVENEVLAPRAGLPSRSPSTAARRQ